MLQGLRADRQCEEGGALPELDWFNRAGGGAADGTWNKGGQ
jgi:hypothetical protein